MATQVQNRRGTTAEHSTFTGAVGELTVDTTKDTVVVHDGAVAGGRPLLREDQSNLPTSAPTTGIYNASGSLAISTGGSGRLFVNSDGKIGVGNTVASSMVGNGITIGTGTSGQASVYTAYSNSDTYGALYFADTTAGAGRYAGGIEYQHSSDALILSTAGSERLRITSAGLVGVGTSSPGARLHSVETSAAEGLRVDGAAGGFSLVVEGGTTRATRLRQATIGNSYGGNTPPTDGLLVQGSVAIGSSQVRDSARFAVSSGETAETISLRPGTSTANLAEILCYNYGTTSYIPLRSIASEWRFEAGAGERARIDSSGRLLVGTSSSVGNGSAVQVIGPNAVEVFRYSAATGNSGPSISLTRSASNTVGTVAAVAATDDLGQVTFRGAGNGTTFIEGASIRATVESGTVSGSSLPTRLVFSTCGDGASSPTERMWITSDGSIIYGKTTKTRSTLGGFFDNGIGSNYFYLSITSGGSRVLDINRQTDDGNLVEFYQADTLEGSISVSGTTVSYNGAHLSRWSQLPSGVEREEILRGTVLSNIDEMCEWGDEDNEQLNRMKVSDVEGDKNVSGVFQAWDDDDDTYSNDFYCAMTGDFIIRIGAGVTVERGDLLMSAGNGTAKPQDDDIIRSKTIAKVTSTNVTCTYEDGSYCVPCVLMAC